MKNTIFSLSLFVISSNVLANSSVVEELKELYRIEWSEKPESMSLQEHWNRLDEIKNRIRPIVSREFAKLTEGESTQLVRDLLKDPDVMDFCWGILHTQFETYSVEIQFKVLNTLFNVAPDSQRGRVIWSFVLDLPKEAFAGKEIQEWLVKKINGGMSAGAYYFILTDESAREVSKTAKTNMKMLSSARIDSDSNLFSLLSAVFLASREDDDAIKLLDSLLDKRNINSLFDTGYVIQAAAMSGNEKLIEKLREIIITDNNSRWIGEDSIPKEISFAHIAAGSCSLTIEGFPSIGYWEEYNDEKRKKINEWLKNNLSSKVKSDYARKFFEETSFQGVITAMGQIDEELSNKK